MKTYKYIYSYVCILKNIGPLWAKDQSRLWYTVLLLEIAIKLGPKNAIKKTKSIYNYKKSTYKQNTFSNAAQDYSKAFLFIPFLDSRISRLNDSLISHKEIIQMLFAIALLTK